jgi:hypothetical protein
MMRNSLVEGPGLFTPPVVRRREHGVSIDNGLSGHAGGHAFFPMTNSRTHMACNPNQHDLGVDGNWNRARLRVLYNHGNVVWRSHWHGSKNLTNQSTESVTKHWDHLKSEFQHKHAQQSPSCSRGTSPALLMPIVSSVLEVKKMTAN